MVCDHATATGSASADVATAARAVSTQTERMRAEVSGFLAKIRQG